jgi:hypothetical protein
MEAWLPRRRSAPGPLFYRMTRVGHAEPHLTDGAIYHMLLKRARRDSRAPRLTICGVPLSELYLTLARICRLSKSSPATAVPT